MDSMRAITARMLGRPENLSIETVPAPVAQAGDVVIAVKAAAVNFPDLLVIAGKYQVRPPLPFSPGKECAGIVQSVGPGVDTPRLGDRVMVQIEYGAFAERAVARAAQCFKMPDSMGFAEAAAIGIAYQTAHFALVDRAGVKPGETVLVTGATGSVGIAAMQLAKTFGCRVFAGLTTMAKSDTAFENGADDIVDLTLASPRDSVRDQVLSLTERRGVDVVIEMVGGEVFEGCLRALAWRGRQVVVGFTSGTIPTLKANYVLLKNIAVSGVNWSDYRDHDPAWVRRVQEEIFALYLAGNIRVPVQASFPMAEFVKAFNVLRDRQVKGKVVLRIAE